MLSEEAHRRGGVRVNAHRPVREGSDSGAETGSDDDKPAAAKQRRKAARAAEQDVERMLSQEMPSPPPSPPLGGVTEEESSPPKPSRKLRKAPPPPLNIAVIKPTTHTAVATTVTLPQPQQAFVLKTAAAPAAPSDRLRAQSAVPRKAAAPAKPAGKKGVADDLVLGASRSTAKLVARTTVVPAPAAATAAPAKKTVKKKSAKDADPAADKAKATKKVKKVKKVPKGTAAAAAAAAAAASGAAAPPRPSKAASLPERDAPDEEAQDESPFLYKVATHPPFHTSDLEPSPRTRPAPAPAAAPPPVAAVSAPVAAAAPASTAAAARPTLGRKGTSQLNLSLRALAASNASLELPPTAGAAHSAGWDASGSATPVDRREVHSAKPVGSSSQLEPAGSGTGSGMLRDGTRWRDRAASPPQHDPHAARPRSPPAAAAAEETQLAEEAEIRVKALIGHSWHKCFVVVARTQALIFATLADWKRRGKPQGARARGARRRRPPSTARGCADVITFKDVSKVQVRSEKDKGRRVEVPRCAAAPR
jgi:hypothetical protein